MLLTIFTPAYNRAEKLKDVFLSLENQINTEFEWLIVDDGSTDNTEEVIAELMKKSSMNIRYYKKENGGKHTAHNMAVSVACGEYFLCLDSDDYMNQNSIEILLKTLKQCNQAEGIVAYKCDQNNQLLSDEFPETDYVSNIYSLSQEFSCNGEFVFLFPTKILQKNKFPVFSGERFLTESVLYDSLKCKMRILPTIIEVCEYQVDGLSNNLNKIMKNNPAGYCLYFMQRIDMQNDLRNRIITMGKYRCFCIFAGKNKSNYSGKYKILLKLSYPVGILMWFYYKCVRGF